MNPTNEELRSRRKEAYKAVESIYFARQATNRWSVSLGEVMAYTGLDSTSAYGALRWLTNRGIVLRVPRGYKPNQFDSSELCWQHGLTRRSTIDCPVCARRERWKKK